LTAFAQAVQDLGYEYVFSFDHVLGADPHRHTKHALPYTLADPFHELFTVFAFITATAPQLGLCTGVLVLPQRQTALVAKQAAEIDFLSGGRLRVGVGSGWNKVEYEALGSPWQTRGPRLDEQIQVLRLLWTQSSVSFRGSFHTLDGAGLNPLPVQKPIPIWIGGGSRTAVRRAALVGDGYLVPGQPPADPLQSPWPEVIAAIYEMRRSEGLDLESYGVEARPIPFRVEGWEVTARAWQAAGATHISVTTLGALRGKPHQRAKERERDGLTSVDDHIAELVLVRSALSGVIGSLGNAGAHPVSNRHEPDRPNS
jgi:probable F420-dependent oxidoreductase